MVELALVAPFIFLIIGGVMDFSNSFYIATAVADAAEAGATYGVYSTANNTDYTGMQNAAVNSQPYISGISATATQYCEDTNNNSVSCSATGTIRVYIDVSVSAPYSLLSSYILLPQSLTATARARRRIQ
jgi:Flp pilus assembly protein TadG